jgi:hypothetical protein
MINAHHNVAEYSGKYRRFDFLHRDRLNPLHRVHPFDCTLGGPFANLFFT